jgi:hypothetical protein
MTTPSITHVAINYLGVIHALPKPNRHHAVIRMIGGIGGPHTEGFLDSTGRFHGRIAAMQLAKDSGQLNRRKGKQYYQGPELYSEDIW